MSSTALRKGGGDVVRQVMSGMQCTGVPHVGNYLGAMRNWLRLQNSRSVDAATAADASADATFAEPPDSGPRLAPREASAVRAERAAAARSKLAGVPEAADGAWPRLHEAELAAGDGNTLFMLADLHALTVPQDPAALRSDALLLAATMLAIGIDPTRSVLFQQSRVAGHSELAWFLQCMSSMGRLNRMTQFKDKASKAGRDAASVGLFAYPALMAADVLLYNATHVPVGDDQTQHLEYARDIAGAVNERAGSRLLRIPQPLFTTDATARVMSLRDGRKKMSKSDPVPKSRINMTDTADEIRKKIMGSKTDSLGEVASPLDEALRPEVANLVALHAAFTDMPVEQVMIEFDGLQLKAVKERVADAAIAEVVPIGDKVKALLKDDRTYVVQTLDVGAEAAQEIARVTVSRVHDAFGLKLS